MTVPNETLGYHAFDSNSDYHMESHISLLEESARANPYARIRPLSHASVDRAGGAESVGSNYFS